MTALPLPEPVEDDHTLGRVYEQKSGHWTADCTCRARLTAASRRYAVDAHANHALDCRDDLSRCPECGADLGYEQDGQLYTRKLGISVPGVDGVLLWKCPECFRAWHRHADDPMRAVAQPFIDVCNAGVPA